MRENSRVARLQCEQGVTGMYPGRRKNFFCYCAASFPHLIETATFPRLIALPAPQPPFRSGLTPRPAPDLEEWAIGFGEAHHGDRKAIVEADDWIGPAFQTRMNVASVARAFEPSRRREALSFTHHNVSRRSQRKRPTSCSIGALKTWPSAADRARSRAASQTERLLQQAAGGLEQAGDGPGSRPAQCDDGGPPPRHPGTSRTEGVSLGRGAPSRGGGA